MSSSGKIVSFPFKTINFFGKKLQLRCLTGSSHLWLPGIKVVTEFLLLSNFTSVFRRLQSHDRLFTFHRFFSFIKKLLQAIYLCHQENPENIFHINFRYDRTNRECPVTYFCTSLDIKVTKDIKVQTAMGIRKKM